MKKIILVAFIFLTNLGLNYGQTNKLNIGLVGSPSLTTLYGDYYYNNHLN